MGRCLRMGKTHTAVAPQKVASQNSSSIREMARKRPIEPLIPTPQSEQAAAPQAHLRPNLWTNRSCSAAWSTSSSSSPDLSPCILHLDRWTKLRVTGLQSCSQGPWFQRARALIIWRHAQDQGWSRGSVLLLSLLPASSS